MTDLRFSHDTGNNFSDREPRMISRLIFVTSLIELVRVISRQRVRNADSVGGSGASVGDKGWRQFLNSLGSFLDVLTTLDSIRGRPVDARRAMSVI